ncbi:MAG TPA: hypothetical protein VMD79_14755 [Solirubrobacteraceae bacterium]|nr:hypothetical protein [Solirubrobacteraceae bacterium]
MSILRSARIPVLLASLATFAAAVMPASAPARTPEERAQQREERTQQHEARVHAREERTQQREERAEQRAESAKQREQDADRHGSPADGPRGRRCRLTVEASSPRIVSGETVGVSGQLTCAESASAGGQVVTVYRSSRGTPTSELGSAVTEADGSYELTTPALEQSSIISVAAGSARRARARVRVAPRITLSASPAQAQIASAHGGAGAQATFSGTVGPAFADAHVALQSSFAAEGEHWRTLAYGRADTQGEYSFTHTFRVPGERRVRVVVRTTYGDVRAASEPVEYDVLGRQNPALTIESSSAMSTFGQAITISGVAEQPAGTSVQLLARSGGDSFAVLATATTDEAGAYSFTEQPTQRTGYQVRDAATHSTTLWHDVSYDLVQNAPPSSPVAGQPATFTGTLAPAPSGVRVELEGENASGFGFHPLAGAEVEGSSYSIAHTFAIAGSYTLRIKVAAGAAGTAGVTGTTGAAFTLQVAAS